MNKILSIIVFTLLAVIVFFCVATLFTQDDSTEIQLVGILTDKLMNLICGLAGLGGGIMLSKMGNKNSKDE